MATVQGTPPPVEGGFTIALMPDTQFYAQLHPEIFHKQTQWIADNAAKQNIKFVIQVGDVTQNSVDEEWQVARDAFKRLEGKVPWSSAPGNHDYGGNLQILARRSPFSLWLPPATFQAMPTYGGVYDKQPDKSENQWHHFEAGGRKWLVIGIEFAPRADVLRWASEVIGAHPDHSAILFTHAYLDPRTNQHIKLSASVGKKAKGAPPETKPAEKPDLSQGEDMWQQVASKHANVVLVLSGHACYTNHNTSVASTGQIVQEMVVDYQSDLNGGNGWMRLLQVHPDGKTVRCRDFSPWIDKTCTMPDRTFDFELATPAK
jgi:3',5'-cyclic AMP phosphodiesterase CpdA